MLARTMKIMNSSGLRQGFERWRKAVQEVGCVTPILHYVQCSTA